MQPNYPYLTSISKLCYNLINIHLFSTAYIYNGISQAKTKEKNINKNHSGPFQSLPLAQVQCHKPNTAGDPEGFHQEPAACQYKLLTAFSEYLSSQEVNALFLVHTQVVVSHYEPDLTDAEMSHIPENNSFLMSKHSFELEKKIFLYLQHVENTKFKYHEIKKNEQNFKQLQCRLLANIGK